MVMFLSVVIISSENELELSLSSPNNDLSSEIDGVYGVLNESFGV